MAQGHRSPSSEAALPASVIRQRGSMSALRATRPRSSSRHSTSDRTPIQRAVRAGPNDNVFRTVRCRVVRVTLIQGGV